MSTEEELAKYLNYLQNLEDIFLDYFNNDDEKYFENLQNYFDENKIFQNKLKFTTTLFFVSKFSNNCFRSCNFVDKIEKILLFFMPFFQKYFNNNEIFDIFKENKLVLLLLFNNKIIIPDEKINSIISSDPYKIRDYPQYFYKEFKSFNESKSDESEDYDEKRRIGQNDDFICELIRKDDVVSFIKYINQTNYNINSNIKHSIYETNPFLIEKTPTILEYASFFGSIQIFRYLLFNKARITDSLWIYTIHSKNYELIHLLEENNIQPKDDNYDNNLIECLKCFSNEIYDYIINQKIQETDKTEDFKLKYLLKAVKSHNYKYIPCDYNLITQHSEFLVLLTQERYYELFKIILNIRVGPGILCSCIEATIDGDKKSTLYCAVENNDIEMLKILMSSETFNTYGKSSINKNIIIDPEEDKYNYVDNKTALYLAVEKGYYEIVKLLLTYSKGCNINEESVLTCNHEASLLIVKEKFEKMPIHAAIENGDNRILELLLTSNNIDVNSEYKYVKELTKPFEYTLNEIEKKTALQMSIEKDNINAVRLLLSNKKIDVNKINTTKIDKNLDGYQYDEDNQGNEEEEQPGDNERDKQVRCKKTALHLAVEKNKIEIVKLLLNHNKIDINCREKYQLIKPLLKIDSQKTCLQIAIEKKEIEILKLLLEQKSISLNERIPYKFDREPKNAFQNYENENEDENENENENENMHNTDKKDIINKSSEHHEYSLKTPLHVAVQTGCIEIIKMLLNQKSIDTQIDDGQGKLPIDYTENPEIKALLTKV